jgi:hypothetical protein
MGVVAVVSIPYEWFKRAHGSSEGPPPFPKSH